MWLLGAGGKGRVCEELILGTHALLEFIWTLAWDPAPQWNRVQVRCPRLLMSVRWKQVFPNEMQVSFGHSGLHTWPPSLGVQPYFPITNQPFYRGVSVSRV